MKHTLLIVLLLIGGWATAQTTFKEADIDAASGNAYETLLTNVEFGFNDDCISSYLQKIKMMWNEKYIEDKKDYYLSRYEKTSIIGKEKQGYVYVKHYLKTVPEYEFPMTTKVEIWGDWDKVVEFYVGFWSRKLSFTDVKQGEVVSTRFLTDVATLSFPDSNTAKITVVTAKDR